MFTEKTFPTLFEMIEVPLVVPKEKERCWRTIIEGEKWELYQFFGGMKDKDPVIAVEYPDGPSCIGRAIWRKRTIPDNKRYCLESLRDGRYASEPMGQEPAIVFENMTGEENKRGLHSRYFRHLEYYLKFFSLGSGRRRLNSVNIRFSDQFDEPKIAAVGIENSVYILEEPGFVVEKDIHTGEELKRCRIGETPESLPGDGFEVIINQFFPYSFLDIQKGFDFDFKPENLCGNLKQLRDSLLLLRKHLGSSIRLI